MSDRARALSQIQRTLRDGELGVALKAIDAFLRDDPDDIDALYLQAVALRIGQAYKPALATLKRLQSLAPANARALQELGHLYRDTGDARLAAQTYARAFSLNPALEASLAECARLAEGQPLGLQARHQLDWLKRLAPELRVALDLISQNKLVKAETAARQYLKDHPDNVEGMRILADIGTRLGVLDDAEFLLESAAEFAPDNLSVRMDYVQILRKRQKFAAALDEAKQLLADYPEHPQVKSICAIEHMQIGDIDRALELLDQVLDALPGEPRTLVTSGHALKTAGRADEAIARYQSAMKSDPAHGESYYALANLKTYRFGASEIEHMRTLLDDDVLGLTDRVHVHFALAKASEDSEDFEAAFAHYAAGNALKKAESRYDADQMQAEFAATAKVCDARFFETRDGFGHDARDPIFVVGLPRAGSTLLEQILSSHSQVDGTLELPNVLSLSQRLRRRGPFPDVLADLTADECLEFGQAYIEETRIHRAGAPFFVDKMPNNFRHLGLIRLMLPNAKIIDARREPMACCFSGFKQLFAEGQEFSYSLEDLGRYYVDYVDLMSHWQMVLPGFVLRVRHEDVVDHLEDEVRRILEFCGLPFEDACIRFHETQRSVRTPSSEQVRQPIFREGLDQWRHFEPWLDPLKAALQR